MKYRKFNNIDLYIMKDNIASYQKDEVIFADDLFKEGITKDLFTFYEDHNILAIICYEKDKDVGSFLFSQMFLDNYNKYLRQFYKEIKNYVKENNIKKIKTCVKKDFTQGKNLIRPLGLKTKVGEVRHPLLGKYEIFEGNY